MKKTVLLAALGAVSLTLSGCKQAEEAPVVDAAATTTEAPAADAAAPAADAAAPAADAAAPAADASAAPDAAAGAAPGDNSNDVNRKP